jgi:hypothetical protein
MTRYWFRSVLLMFALAAGLQGQTRETILKKLADKPGWVRAGDSSHFGPSDIEQLISLKTSVVKSYGAAGATQENWKSTDGTTRVTLIEMNDTSAAYGLFTQQRNVEGPYSSSSFGAESFRAANDFWFWQSRYVVGLRGDSAAVTAAARTLSESILGNSKKPPVSEHLPPEHLLQGTEKYILSPDSIDLNAGIDPAKLGFEDSVEIATARYDVSGKPARLWLLLYPTQQVAKKYADLLSINDAGTGKFEKRVGPLIALVRGTQSSEAANEILSRIGYESKVTWNERRPDIAISDVILTTFMFIGLALAFTAVAGMSFGGFRVFVKSRFPNRVFDRGQDMEIIQLHIDQSVTRKELGG